MISWLGGNLVVGLLALAMLAVVIYRLVKHPELLAAEKELAWDYASRPAATGNAELTTLFGAEALAAAGETAQQARLALVNKGREPVTAADFRGPLRLVLPAGSRAVAVTPAGRDAAASENSVSLQPCPIAARDARVFDILICGAAAPVRLDGGLKDTPVLRQLRGRARYFTD